jgi:hypothetical protein
MDDERTRDQKNRSAKPRGERGREPRRAADGFLLLEALPMLFAAALIASGMPQALPTAANPANAPAAIFKDSEPTDQRDQALERIEETDEPLITDDLRTQEVMYALANVPGAMSAAHRKPSIVGRERC